MKTSKTIKVTPELEKQSEILLNSDQNTISNNLLKAFTLLNNDKLVQTRFTQEFHKNQVEFKDLLTIHQKAYEEIKSSYNWFLDYYNKYPVSKKLFFSLDSISNNLFIYSKDNIYSANIVMNKFQNILQRYIEELNLDKKFNYEYQEFYDYYLIGKIDPESGEEYPPFQLGLNQHFKNYSEYQKLLAIFESNQKKEPWYNYFHLNHFIEFKTEQKYVPDKILAYLKPLPITYQKHETDSIEGYSLDEIKSAWISVFSFLKKHDRHRDKLHYENGIIFYKDKQLPLLEDSKTKDIFEFIYKFPEEEFLVEGIIKGIKDQATNESYNELKKETVYQLIKSLNDRAVKILEIPVFIKPSKKVIKIDNSLLR